MMTADRFIAIKEVKKPIDFKKDRIYHRIKKKQISKASQFWQSVGMMATIKNQQTN